MKRTTIALILTILISGVGHMYLRQFKRGAIILASAICLGIAANLFLGPWSLVLTVPYWIWVIYDVYKVGKQMETSTLL